VNADAALAARLAQTAGALLLEVRHAGGTDGEVADLGRRGDRESNAFLLRQLAQERPGDAVLSEEAEDDLARLEAARVWIIDPLDGTREFAMPGRQDWAVHVALWERGGAGITAAAVALPATGELFASDPAPPALPAPSASRPGGASGPAAVRTRPLILVSDSRPPAFAASVAAEVGADVAPMGSAGAKAMAVVRGDAAAYLHAGGQWEWDSAAPVGVAQAAGLHASRLDGSPLRYNEPRPYLPDLLVCRPELAAPLLAALVPYR
jgi:3'(2'), 5'-bisphosphate nucleotidase